MAYMAKLDVLFFKREKKISLAAGQKNSKRQRLGAERQGRQLSVTQVGVGRGLGLATQRGCERGTCWQTA